MTSPARPAGSALRDSVRVRPADAAWAFAFRAGLAVAVPMIALVALGRPSWAAIAAFGSFTALYARDELYRPRSRQLALVALGLVAAVTAGTVAALLGGVAPVLVVALTGGVATWLCTACRVGPPAGLMFAFAAAVTGALPATAGDVGRHAALTAAAATWAWLVAMAGAALDRDAPRRLAVARALRAVAALEDVQPGTSGLTLRHRAAVAVERAWRALPAVPPPGPRGALIADLESLCAHAESAFAAVHVQGEAARRAPAWAPGGSGVPAGEPAVDWAELRTLAAGTGRSGPLPRVRRSRTEIAEIAGRHLAAELSRRPHFLRPDPADGGRIWLGGPAIPVAARVALGALLAGLAGHVLGGDAGLLAGGTGLSATDAVPLAGDAGPSVGGAGLLTGGDAAPAGDAGGSGGGLGHAYWAAVSAVAVLQTPNLLGSVHRTVQRAVGTLLGVAVAAAAILLLPSQWAYVAAIVLLQVVAELLVVRNYGLAMLAVTPLAILVGELAHPAPATGLIRDRLLQTVLGCVIGLLCAVLIRNRAAVRHLASVTAACRAAVTELRERLADPGADPRPAARRVATLLTAVREAHDVVSGEPGRTPTDAEMVLRTEQNARHALTAAAARLHTL